MKAHTRNLRISPRKLNIIAGIVRGMPVEAALAQLKFTPKKGAKILYKTIASAAANAESQQKMRRRNLVVESVVVQKGTMLRRGIPVSRGRWHTIYKYMSHVSVGLKEVPQEKPVAKKGAKTAAATTATPAPEAPGAATPEKKVRTKKKLATA